LVHVLINPVVDPKADNRSNLVRNFEKTSEYTADGRNGKLSDVAWDCRSNATAGKPSEDSTSIFFQRSAFVVYRMNNFDDNSIGLTYIR
jgi:hypothetical protein